MSYCNNDYGSWKKQGLQHNNYVFLHLFLGHRFLSSDSTDNDESLSNANVLGIGNLLERSISQYFIFGPVFFLFNVEMCIFHHYFFYV